MNREDWNRRYQGRELVWSAEPNRFLVEEVNGLEPGTALDLGAGEGRNAIWLAEHGWTVTAVDFSDVALDKAQHLAAERGVGLEIVRADLTAYVPEPTVFDLVLVLYLHLPWPEMKRVVERAARAVTPGGTLLLIGHDRSNLDHGHGGPRSPEMLYTAEQITGLLSGMRIEDAGTRLRPVATDHDTVSAIDCLVRARAVD